jgi:hypothetical protein
MRHLKIKVVFLLFVLFAISNESFAQRKTVKRKPTTTKKATVKKATVKAEAATENVAAA